MVLWSTEDKDFQWVTARPIVLADNINYISISLSMAQRGGPLDKSFFFLALQFILKFLAQGTKDAILAHSIDSSRSPLYKRYFCHVMSANDEIFCHKWN